MFEIEHHPSGDVAEAQGRPAALTAARTLLEDNGFVEGGRCRIWQGGVGWGQVVDIVWADNAESYSNTTLGCS